MPRRPAPRPGRRRPVEDVAARERQLAAVEKKIAKILLDCFGTDDSGDPRVELLLVDRTRYERLHYKPVPYWHRATSNDGVEAIRRAVHVNLEMASEAHDTYERLESDRRREVKVRG